MFYYVLLLFFVVLINNYELNSMADTDIARETLPNTVEAEVKTSEKGQGSITNSELLSRHKRAGTRSCPRVASCKLMAHRGEHSCYCDKFCRFYKDCCYDAPRNASTAPPTMMVKIHSSKCTKFTSMSDIDYGFQMVVKCPQDFNITTDINLDYMAPVSGSDRFIYKNEECAKCHGISSFSAWGIVYSIEGKECTLSASELLELDKNVLTNHEAFGKILKERQCPSSFYQRNTYTVIPRLCFPTLSEDSDRCDDYIMPIQSVKSSIIFNNTDCCRRSQNLESSWNDSCIPLDGQCLYFPRPDMVRSNFKEDVNDIDYETPQYIVLQPKDTKCEVEMFGDCSPIRLINFRIPVTMVASSLSTLDVDILQRAFIAMELYLSNAMYRITPENQIKYKTGSSEDETGGNIFISSFNISLRLKITLFQTTELEYVQKWLNNFTFKYTEILDGNTSYVIFQTSEEKKEKFLSDLKNIELGTLILKKDNLSTNNLRLYKELQQSLDIPYRLCEALECNVTLNAGDLRWSWHCDYKHWYYILRYKNDHPIGPENILTYACFTVSCISLLVSFPLHRCSQMSKTVPGKNMENLMVTLFLSQVTFMFGIGQEERTFCMVSSIMIHYFYLSSFCWMNLCMVHIMFVLSRMKKYPNQSLNSGATCRRFAPMVITGYTLPACIVIPCVLFDFILDSDIKVGYIENGICFPSHYPENLYVFVIPICVSLFINILCLLRVIFIINTAVPDGFDNTKFRRYVPVYLKLTIVSGLSWMFGIISESTGNIFLRYCFILCTGLQGLMLCISFVFSGSVWADIKSRILCCSEQDTTSTIIEMTTTPSKE